MMQPDITLSLIVDGKLVSTPVKFTFAKFEADGCRFPMRSRQGQGDIEAGGRIWLVLSVGKSTTEVYLIENVLVS